MAQRRDPRDPSLRWFFVCEKDFYFTPESVSALRSLVA